MPIYLNHILWLPVSLALLTERGPQPMVTGIIEPKIHFIFREAKQCKRTHIGWNLDKCHQHIRALIIEFEVSKFFARLFEATLGVRMNYNIPVLTMSIFDSTLHITLAMIEKKRIAPRIVDFFLTLRRQIIVGDAMIVQRPWYGDTTYRCINR